MIDYNPKHLTGGGFFGGECYFSHLKHISAQMRDNIGFINPKEPGRNPTHKSSPS